MYSRRDFGKLAGLAVGIPLSRLDAASKVDSTIRGVLIGAQSYSFRDLPLDGAIDGMKQIGLGECELAMGHVEPAGMSGDDLKNWRINTPLSYFEDIRKKVAAAGIRI